MTPVIPATPVAAEVPVAAEPVDAPSVAGLPAAPADARFQLAAYRDGVLALHLLGDEVFVSGAGGLARLDARGDRLVGVEYAMSGQSEPYWWFDGWETVSFGGLWPDNAWLVTEYGFSRSNSPPRVHRREGNFWKLQDNKKGLLYWGYPMIVNGRPGEVLGLRTWGPDPILYEDGGEASPAVDRRVTKEMAAVQRGFDVLGPTPTPATMVIAPDLVVIAVAAAPGGELFLLGRKRGKNIDSPRVQRWGLEGDAAITGTVDSLLKGKLCEHLVVRAANDAYVGCWSIGTKKGAYLVHFDGTSWTEEPSPDAYAFSSLSLSPEGELYAIIKPRGVEDGVLTLVRRSARGAAWEPVELPALRFPDRGAPEWAFYTESHDFELTPADPVAAAATWSVRPTQVIARGGGEVWVVGTTDLERTGLASYQTTREVVLRAGKVALPLRMLPDGDLAVEVRDWKPAPAWTPKGCAYEEDALRPAFVALHTLPRDAPRNQPEPTIEAFVKEHAGLMGQVHRVVEVFHRGRRTTGLYVWPKDQAGADALLVAIGRAWPDEKRALECRLPRIRREFDKTTGLALQAPLL